METAWDEPEDARLIAAGGTEAGFGRFNDLVLHGRGAGDFQRERIRHQLDVVRILVHCNHAARTRMMYVFKIVNFSLLKFFSLGLSRSLILYKCEVVLPLNY